MARSCNPSLADANPKIAALWHWLRNGSLKPRDVTPYSHKCVWWRCDKGHEWQARVGNMQRGRGCPACWDNEGYTKHVIAKHGSLASRSPAIAAQWHPTKNESLTPVQVTNDSARKVWWLCPKGHAWRSAVNKRSQGRSCPYCAGKAVGADNSLAHECPELAALWHPTHNGNLSPVEISKSSHRRAWWKCDCGHEWQATVNNVRRGRGCPACWQRAGVTNQAIKQRGSLATNRPDIAAGWHPTKNCGLHPHHVTSRCNKKVWWLCKCGNEWQAQVASRVAGTGCPKCGVKKLGELRRKRALKDSGSIAETHPHLLTEWHPTKNVGIGPTEISGGSHQSIWWICKQGHEWQAIVKSRTNEHGCPFCSPQSSRLEIRLLCELRALFPEVVWRKRFTPYECDIFISDLRLGIEVDGFIWHKDRLEQDRRKNKTLSAQGVELIRVRGTGLSKVSAHDIAYSETENPLAIVHRLLQILLPRVNDGETRKNIAAHIAANDFVNEKEYKAILAALPRPAPERSFEAVCPHLVKEWHPKNLPLTPAMFPAFTHKKVWWTCSKGHPDYLASLARRASGRGCPVCGKEARANATINAAIKRSGTVEEALPQLLPEWHPTLNLPLTPGQLSAGSKQDIWWRCKLDHVWKASADQRKRGSGCPECVKATRGEKVRQAAVRRGSLADNYPAIAALWHPTKNGNLRPSQVPGKSNMKVWWLCEKGHASFQTISSRTDGVGCPECYKSNRREII